MTKHPIVPGPAAARAGASARDSVVVVAANNAASYLGLALMALVTSRYLGSEGRGVVVLFTTTESFCLLVAACGVNTVARVRLVAATDRLAMADFLGFAVVLAIVDMALCASVGTLVLDASGALVTPLVMPLLVALSGVHLAGYFVRDALAAFGHNNAATRADVIYATTQLVALLIVQVLAGLTVNAVLVIVVAATAVQLSYLLITLRAQRLIAWPRFAWTAWWRHLRLSWPALGLTFGQAGAFKLDRLVLGLLTTPAAVGIYSVAATVGDLVSLVPLSIAQVTFSTVARDDNRSRLLRLKRLNIAVTMIVVVVFLLAAPSIVHTVFGPAFADAVTPLLILLVAGIPTAIYHVNITAVTASGRIGAAAQAPAVGLIVCLLLDLLLIPPFGIVGAACASLVTYTGMAVHARLLTAGPSRRWDAERGMGR